MLLELIVLLLLLLMDILGCVSPPLTRSAQSWVDRFCTIITVSVAGDLMAVAIVRQSFVSRQKVAVLVRG